MNIVFINSVCGIGSTGKICLEKAIKYEKMGHNVRIAHGRSNNVHNDAKRFSIRIGNSLDVLFHKAKTLITDRHAFGSKLATRKFLKWLDKFNPDLIWLHNLHGYYINIEMLFGWIKLHPNINIKWTLHDCWAFTGHCTHFIMENCDKWKKQCYNCPQRNRYPSSYLIDNSKNNFIDKKRIFSGIENLELITPSKWLAELTRYSFLSQYPVSVEYNQINKEIFRYRKSDFRKKYGLQNKKIVLCVAGNWSERKGIGDIVKLANIIDENTIIVIVGVSKKQKKNLPENIIGIERTENAIELAEIYSSSDLFFNPTREDTYPTVNLEAESCGLKVLTYNVGGASETIRNSESKSISVGDYKKVLEEI